MIPSSSLRFFKDNTSGGGIGEDARGRIACIRVFDQAFAPATVAEIHAQGGCSYAGAESFGDDTNAPNTKLRRRPPKRGTDRTPTFRFRSSEAGSTFRCKLDRKRFRRCTSPFTANRLEPGLHHFRVKAVDASGNGDPTPARYSFRILG